MAEAHAAPHRGESVAVEIGAISLTPSLTCLDSPRRASDSLSNPQAGGAGRANGARLDGVARAWPARQEQANRFPSAGVTSADVDMDATPHGNDRGGPWPDRSKKTASTPQKIAGSRNVDLKGISKNAPAGEFMRCPLNLNSHNHNQHAGRPCFYLAVFNRGNFANPAAF